MYLFGKIVSFLKLYGISISFQLPLLALGVVTLAIEESSVSLSCSLFSASDTLFTGVLTAGAEIEEKFRVALREPNLKIELQLTLNICKKLKPFLKRLK